MTTPRRRKISIALTVLWALAVIAGLMFLGRGWIRGTLMPAYVNMFYKHGVAREAEKDFPPVTAKLEALGLHFRSQGGYNRDIHECMQLAYEWISSSYYCLHTTYSNPAKLDDAYIADWNKQSPAFEKYLLDNGWTKGWNERQPINELLDARHDQSYVAVNYIKENGKMTCTVSIARMPNTKGDQFFATESCARSVYLFGEV